jgi:hypothetical protein
MVDELIWTSPKDEPMKEQPARLTASMRSTRRVKAIAARTLRCGPSERSNQAQVASVEDRDEATSQPDGEASARQLDWAPQGAGICNPARLDRALSDNRRLPAEPRRPHGHIRHRAEDAVNGMLPDPEASANLREG